MRSISVSAPLSNHYETLGIDRSADAKEIKAAYYELSKKYHPDRHTDASDKQHAAIKFQEVYFDKVQPMWKRREGGRLYHSRLPCVIHNHRGSIADWCCGVGVTAVNCGVRYSCISTNNHAIHMRD